MQSERQPPDRDQEPVVSGKYVAHLLLFVILVFLLYVFPEIMVFKQHGFAPVEHLVDAGPNPTLGGILASMWSDRAELLNPLNNPLVRFFLVTMIVGVVFDQVKKYAPAADEERDLP